MKFFKYICIYFSIVFFMSLNTKANNDMSIVGADSVLLVDMKFDKILYKDNIHRKCYPASTTKIMTALLAIEYLDLNKNIIITKNMMKNIKNGVSTAGLKIGEKIKVIDLLYYLLLPSANEAANALAISVSGDIKTFARLMNTRAIQLGCRETKFTNANGLHDPAHYTTAYDLYLITKQAMKNKLFRRLVRSTQRKIPGNNLRLNPRKIYTTNMLILRQHDPLFFEHCIGVKTGYTRIAKHCFVSMAVYRRCHLISVILGMDNDIDINNTTFTATKKLFEWALDNFYYKVFIMKRSMLIAIPFKYSDIYKQDLIMLLSNDSIHTIVNNDIFSDDLIEIWDIHKNPNYNIKRGQIMGQVILRSRNEILGHIILLSSENIYINKTLYLIEKIQKSLHPILYKFFTFISLIICLILIISF